MDCTHLESPHGCGRRIVPDRLGLAPGSDRGRSNRRIGIPQIVFSRTNPPKPPSATCQRPRLALGSCRMPAPPDPDPLGSASSAALTTPRLGPSDQQGNPCNHGRTEDAEYSRWIGHTFEQLPSFHVPSHGSLILKSVSNIGYNPLIFRTPVQLDRNSVAQGWVDGTGEAKSRRTVNLKKVCDFKLSTKCWKPSKK